jgi:hypothetical protein
MVAFVIVARASVKMPPPPDVETLPLIVTLVASQVAALRALVPPPPFPVLPLIVESFTTRFPLLK